jgi:PAS domain S-box-containing protein
MSEQNAPTGTLDAPGPAPTIVADREGVIRAWAANAQAIFGHTPAEAIGKSLELIVPEEYHADHWAGFHRAMASGETKYKPTDVLPVPARHKDGSTLMVELQINPLRDSAGHVTGMQAFIRQGAAPT